MALVGPPPKPKPEEVLPSFNPFLDNIITKFNDLTPSSPPTPPKGHTQSESSIFLSSGNPCLDLFFQVLPNTHSDTINEKLNLSWDHNPVTTLKLICHLRGIRGTGKSDREGFFTAALWLHGRHPKTLACNIASIAHFGCLKDFPEILYRILEGAEVRDLQRDAWKMKREFSQKRKRRYRDRSPVWKPFHRLEGGSKYGTRGGKRVQKKNPIWDVRDLAKTEKENAREERENKKAERAEKLLKRYRHDPDFRYLHDRVSDYFAGCLMKDLEVMRNSGEMKSISLAAKWCPSVDSSYDRSILLCESIARRIFPREVYTEYEGIEEVHYAYRVRDRLRKEVLVPLRKVLELPEVYIGANRWDLIPYERVASKAMQFYQEKFLKHDKERFLKYLEDVKDGKTSMSFGALLPHEIVGSLWNGDGGGVAELLWRRMVNNMLSKGKIKNCIAVCDVSENMSGTPMEVSLALGLLVSELSDEPWKGKLITFSENPELHLIKGNSLLSKMKFVARMKWGQNTNLQRVFDQILEAAVKGKLRPDEMVQKVFVFSGMEFEKASDKDWETDYEAITRKFTKKGYGSAVPHIVFWNLNNSKASPVPVTQKGVTLVSGFSKNLLTLLLQNDGDISPGDAEEAVKPGPADLMEAAISGPEYQKLIVLD
ncbi:hypothetical protein TanjilG_16154 [Lupinus angustifolius]|uniref:TROVE domain-containing protein n=1 Tax=Lupinus angustifolius TaxID=3871 RepID=A0A1J7HW01_LUPAN|nr:PREDICTED: uncharacterized protein LOC109356715 [Lupinus angustifolius]OIW04691.1 hypothetical protein TanjilG_16154 [Lupinus angustifolius]